MQGFLNTDSLSVVITMLPISAGDATLLSWTNGQNRHAVLIDAGLREHEAVAYLQSIGIYHLDLIILSHPDMDHLGGLLAIVGSQQMSVDRVWCFDLNFLREFVKYGRIPPPQAGTREVTYAYMLRYTLDQFSEILTTTSGRGIQVLQVSEGYRLALGGVLLEVLYPPQSFYDALRSPRAITQLLINRRWPEVWMDEREVQGHDIENARPLSRQERKEYLSEMVEKPQMPDDGVLLSDVREFDETPDERPPDDGEILPWKMVGTLYNNLSIVVKLTVLGGIHAPSALFPGDLSDWTILVQRQWGNLRANVLKLPHHGSKRISVDSRMISYLDEWWRFYFHLKRYYPEYYERYWPWVPYLPRLYDEMKQLERIEGDPIRLFADIVRPSQIIVFPYPQYRLPNISLEQFRNINIVANRSNRKLNALSAKNNPPHAARIRVGLEQDDVREIEV